MTNQWVAILFIVTAGAVFGCASVSPRVGLDEVEQAVGSRAGTRVHWNQDGPEDAEVKQAVEAMLEKELFVEDAVQIALLNNSGLQATFEELGVAQADLVQAGLLKNPVFAGHVRFSDKSGEATNTEFSVSQDFLDLLLRPLRKKLAAAQLEQAQLRIGDAVVSLAAEVRAPARGRKHQRSESGQRTGGLPAGDVRADA